MVRWVFIAVLIWGKLAAAPVLLAERAGTVNLVPESRYLMETDRSYSPATILGELPRFKKTEEGIYNFGFVERPIWITFGVTFPPRGKIGRAHV